MGMAWGFVVVALSVVCWGGQAVSWLAPATAVRFSLAEGEDTVDPTFFADVRGEALWDTLTLWTMPVAGVLLIADNAAWTYFGLVGGAMYLYFAGRGVFTRITMRRRGRADRHPTERHVGVGVSLDLGGDGPRDSCRCGGVPDIVNTDRD